LILHRGPITGGTALTAELARRYGRPLLAVDLDTGPTVAAIRAWLDGQGIRVLNIAGPRESQAPGIAAAALDLLRQLLGERPERVDPA
ncbi:MAG: putative molybdenum carrier protein, partial [Thiohalocapsa sp.]